MCRGCTLTEWRRTYPWLEQAIYDYAKLIGAQAGEWHKFPPDKPDDPIGFIEGSNIPKYGSTKYFLMGQIVLLEYENKQLKKLAGIQA